MRHRLEIVLVLPQPDVVEIQDRADPFSTVASELAEQAASAAADERLIGQLMLALSRFGRQAEALRWFERTRAHLADELGADPGPKLCGLHHQILTADPALELKHPARLSTGPAAQAAPRQLPAAVSHFAAVAELTRD